MATAAKTRTRSSSKATKSSNGRATKAAAKTAAKKGSASKGAATKATAAAQAAAAKKREDAAKAAEAERQAEIKAGKLFAADDGTEFRLTEKDEDGVVLTKAKNIIEALQASPDMPVRKREIAEPNIMSVGIFAALKAMGVVEEFRARSGERGGSGVAYRWVG